MKETLLKRLLAITIGIFLLTSVTMPAQGASIVNSKHDLGAGAGKEPCAFCHTPHGGDPSIAPLWNRTAPNPASFTMYASDTMANLPGQPSNASLACLSCHDGVNAETTNHKVLNVPGSGAKGPKGDYSYAGNCNCHNVYGTNPSLLTDTMYYYVGTDLRDDHPISMAYPTPVQDPDFKTPTDVVNAGLKLFGATNTVECSSCHNVHDPVNTPFLRKSNAGSDLCYTCHTK
jgi:predicted CXXCH cytochrome family protein